MKRLRSNKGLTLLDLIIYMVAVVIVLGIMTSIRSFFFENLDVVKNTAKYAQQFDNFNAYLVKDAKESNDVSITELPVGEGENQFIEYRCVFSNGTVYNYRKYLEKNIGDVYRDSIKVATNVKTFVPTKDVIYINNTEKVLLKINIVIGGNAEGNDVFSKKIQYTLKYW